jgi:tRNA pseudouridine38-40 synthase
VRYFIEIAYNGTHYSGWQRQPNALSVQEVIEEGLSRLLRTSISVVGAGRTDAGVHAKQLFAHFDVADIAERDTLLFRLNSYLPKDIAVRNLLPVTNTAHARFDALSRTYEYAIIVGKDPFLRGLAHQLYVEPSLEAMNEAAAALLEYNDFQCFSRSGTDVKTYHCNVELAVWQREGNKITFTITANRFLRNMVRAVVGTLLDVGYGKTTMEEFHTILKSKDRTLAGASAPAHGLYLTEVTYPTSIFINP